MPLAMVDRAVAAPVPAAEHAVADTQSAAAIYGFLRVDALAASAPSDTIGVDRGAGRIEAFEAPCCAAARRSFRRASMAYSTLPDPVGEGNWDRKLGIEAMHKRSPLRQSITTTDPLSRPMRRAALIL